MVPVVLAIYLPVALVISLPVALVISLPVALAISLPVVLAISLPVALVISLPVALVISLPVTLVISLGIAQEVRLSGEDANIRREESSTNVFLMPLDDLAKISLKDEVVQLSERLVQQFQAVCVIAYCTYKLRDCMAG